MFFILLAVIQGKMWDWDPPTAAEKAAPAAKAAAPVAAKAPIQLATDGAQAGDEVRGAERVSTKAQSAMGTRSSGKERPVSERVDNESLEPKLGDDAAYGGFQTRPPTAGGGEDGTSALPMVID
jgi:hypothetical protein